MKISIKKCVTCNKETVHYETDNGVECKICGTKFEQELLTGGFSKVYAKKAANDKRR